VKSKLFAFAAGSLFASGLAIGGMTQPAKVIGFLDVFGAWDPSLIFVMAGAILTYTPLFWRISGRGVPLFAAQYLIPTKRSIDTRLVVGAAVFGMGWGLAGFCPGPALVSSGSGAGAALIFTTSMLLGMLLHKGFELLVARARAARGDIAASAS
jgi:uncharacterized protein